MSGRFGRLELDLLSPAAPGPGAAPSSSSAAGDLGGDTGRVPPPIDRRETAARLLQQADAEYRQGRCEPALRLYTRCLQEERSLVAAWVGQVRMLVELGELHEACLWSERALELFRGHGELLAARAQACARLGDRREARVAADAALQAPGRSPWRWLARGEVLLARGDPLGEHLLRQAFAEAGSDWFDRLVAARICLHHDRPGLGLDLAQEALSLQPTAGLAWLVLAEAQQELGLRGPARTSYGRAAQLLPDPGPAREGLRRLQQQPSGARLRATLRRLLGRSG
ncbi:MAG: hypothetical protein RBU45_00890 [Myxococcota bacterium]|jgi:tetratricopeptide (TPR) repeat protein|nr:hypothetical protein [Myxococcota bacterium]